MKGPLASWSLDEVRRGRYTEENEGGGPHEASCLIVEKHKLGGASGRAGWADQGKPQRLFLGFDEHSGPEAGLHAACVQALFWVLEMLWG